MSDVDFKDVATAAAVVAAAYFTAGAGLVPGVGPAAPAAAAPGAASTASTAATSAAAAPGAAASAGGTAAGAGATGASITGAQVAQAATTAAVVGGTGMSIVAQQEAAQKQRVANAARQRVSEIQNRRARLRTLEEQRIRSAQAQQAGVGAGLGAGTTSVRGTVASLRSQAAGNIGMQQTMAAGERSIFMSEQAAARSAGQADLFGAAAQLGGELGGYQPLRDLFG